MKENLIYDLNLVGFWNEVKNDIAFIAKNMEEINFEDYSCPNLHDAYLKHSRIKDFKEKAIFTHKVVHKYIKNLDNQNLSIENFLSKASKAVELSSIYLISKEGNFEKFINPAKDNSSFFTPINITKKLVDLFSNNLTSKNSYKILDPSGGIGILGFLAAQKINNIEPNSKIELTIVEKNITIFEYLSITKEIIKKYFKKNNLHINIKNEDFLDFFHTHHLNKYDLIIMNPPYSRLRVLKTSLTNKETNLENQKNSYLLKKLDEIEFQNKKINQYYASVVNTTGIIELSRLFVELSCLLLNRKSKLVAIFPDNWMTSKQSFLFRNYILNNLKINYLECIKEKTRIFETVNQPLCILSLTKSEEKKSFPLLFEDQFGKNQKIQINQNKLINDRYLLKIPKINQGDRELIDFLIHKEKFSDYDSVKNLRGELDLSFGKKYLDFSKGTVLIRGDSIFRGRINRTISKKEGFLDFQETDNPISKNKQQYIKSQRIAIRQSSYINQKFRIYSCIVPKGCIISNSCNFICVTNEEKLFGLLAILLSSIIDIYFRCFNSNNHVSNYEISDFPLGNYESEKFLEFSLKAKEILSKSSFNQEYLDNAVMEYFEIRNHLISKSSIYKYWKN